MKRPRPVFAPIVFFAAAFLLVFWLGWTVAVQAHAADPLKHALSLLGVGLVGGGVAHLIHREAKRQQSHREAQANRGNAVRLKPTIGSRVDKRV